MIFHASTSLLICDIEKCVLRKSTNSTLKDNVAECLPLEWFGLVINNPEHVLICTREGCGYALQVTGQRVKQHLWEQHQVPKRIPCWTYPPHSFSQSPRSPR